MPRKTLRDAVLGFFFPSLTKLMKLISDLFGLYDERNALVLLKIHKGLYHV